MHARQARATKMPAKSERTATGPSRVRVADVLTPHVEHIDVTSTVEEAARKMSAVQGGVLPVFEGELRGGEAHGSRDRGPRGGGYGRSF